MEDVWRHVIVCQDRCITCELELLNLFDDRAYRRDLGIGEDTTQAVCGADLDRCRIQSGHMSVTKPGHNSINRLSGSNTPQRTRRSVAATGCAICFIAKVGGTSAHQSVVVRPPLLPPLPQVKLCPHEVRRTGPRPVPLVLETNHHGGHPNVLERLVILLCLAHGCP